MFLLIFQKEHLESAPPIFCIRV